MTTKVFITIDTEEDNWGDYKATVATVENILALPQLQSLFNEYGAVPTYLVNYPVARQQQSVEVLSSFLKEGVCEIGAHCHPWNTPPVEEELNARNSMMCNLDYELLIRKMNCLHKTIEDNFHIKPVVFRAGRWALNEDVARCLSELGYLVDSSMSPFVDWSDNFGPNFRDSSTHPFYFKADNICQHDKVGELLEVPPTIGFYQSNFRLCDKVVHTISNSVLSRLRLLGILDRLQLLNFHWLSPELSSGKEMIKLSKHFVKSGHNYLNMSFHSTSLLPGKSPFVRNERELILFLDKIEVFLQYATKNNFEFLPLSKAISLVERD